MLTILQLSLFMTYFSTNSHSPTKGIEIFLKVLTGTLGSFQKHTTTAFPLLKISVMQNYRAITCFYRKLIPKLIFLKTNLFKIYVGKKLITPEVSCSYTAPSVLYLVLIYYPQLLHLLK